MNEDKLRIARASAKACDGQALAVALRLTLAKGTSTEWRTALVEEAANRLENNGKGT